MLTSRHSPARQMRVCRLSLLVIVVVVPLFGHQIQGYAETKEATKSPNIAITRMQEAVSRLRTVQLNSVWHCSHGNYVSEQSSVLAGERYRVERRDQKVDPGRISFSQVFTHDGDKYYKLDEDQQSVKVSSSGRSGASNPIFTIYNWFFGRKCQQPDWALLQSDENWRALRENAVTATNKRIDGRDCFGFSVSQSCASNDFEFRVWVDARSWIPVESTLVRLSDGAISSHTKSDKWMSFPLNGESASIMLPTLVTFEQFDIGTGGAAFVERHEISESSVSLNLPVSDDLFVVEVDEETQSVRDVDSANKKIQDLEDTVLVAPVAELQSNHAAKYLFIAANIAFGMLLIAFIWARRPAN